MDEISFLENLLSIYSPTGQETEAVNFTTAQMQSLGFTATVDGAGNAVGTIGSGRQTIMLLGHIDTVPGFIPVERTGDKLTGRGAVDAKGPLACFISAAHRAHQAGRLTDRRIVVIGAVGEEGTSPGARYVKDHYSRPDFVIIGEPSGWDRITLGYKGTTWHEYRVTRSVAHTAAKYESACEAAMSFWARVADWAEARNRDRERVFDQVTLTLNAMSSAAGDGFQESAYLKFNTRLPLDLSVEEFDHALRGLICDAELKLLDGVPAFRCDKNNPLVRAFLAAIRRNGGTPTFALKTGTADMNIVGPVWQTPTVAYGPGDSTLDHTPQEHILLSEYRRAIEVLTQVLGEVRSAS